MRNVRRSSNQRASHEEEAAEIVLTDSKSIRSGVLAEALESIDGTRWWGKSCYTGEKGMCWKDGSETPKLDDEEDDSHALMAKFFRVRVMMKISK